MDDAWSFGESNGKKIVFLFMFIFQYFAKKHSFTESANIFSIAMLF